MDVHQMSEAPSPRPKAGRWRRVINYLEEKAARPGFATWISLLTFFAGLWVSFGSAKIRAAFPFELPLRRYLHLFPLSQWEPNLFAIGFWLFLTLWLFLFWIRQRAESAGIRDQRAQVSRLSDSVDRVDEHVQTLPPPNFRQTLVTASDDAYRALNEISQRNFIDAQKSKGLIDAICNMLGTVVHLVAQFNFKSDALYSADVMLYWGLSDLSEEETQAARRFVVEPLTDKDIIGFLVPARSLQPVSPLLAGKLVVKRERQIVVFPIPDPSKKKEGEKWKIPPISPVAFVSGKALNWDNVSTLPSLKNSSAYALTEDVIKELGYYYQETYGFPVMSVCSFPLIFPKNGPEVFGVLNVYCSMKDIFSGDTQAEIFTAVTTPLINQICEACYLQHGLGRT
jgi:hypothetical protein